MKMSIKVNDKNIASAIIRAYENQLGLIQNEIIIFTQENKNGKKVNFFEFTFFIYSLIQIYDKIIIEKVDKMMENE